MDYLRSDCILKEVLEDRKTLTGFLDAVFGFMSRNTDFYHVQNTKDDKLGFPRGIKEQILMSCMQKYEHKLEQPNFDGDLAFESPLVAEEVEIVTEEKEQTSKNQKTSSTNVKKFGKADYKNGSVFDNYCWSQTLKDVELSILLPKEVKLAKHIKFDLKSNFMTITTLVPKEEILISGGTWDKYRHNDIIWSISDGKLTISFDKLKECWWDKLFSYENLINIKDVDTERSINEYSMDIQNTIEQLPTQGIYYEHQKALTLTESEQIARLRQAWNTEGSPFKGRPFDPSVIQFR